MTTTSTLTTRTASRHELHGLPQQLEAVGVLPSWVGVGEVPADVSRRGGAEHGIRDGMAERVGIGVAREARAVWNRHAAEEQRTSLDETVRIVPEADPHTRPPGRRSTSSSFASAAAPARDPPAS